jgi:hypothetical protein
MEQNSLLGKLGTAQITLKTRSGLHKIAPGPHSRKVSFAPLGQIHDFAGAAQHTLRCEVAVGMQAVVGRNEIP